jgi:protein O-GlcNAc transferase
MFLRALMDVASGHFRQGLQADAFECYLLLTSAAREQQTKSKIAAPAYYNMAVVHKKRREYLPAVKFLEKALEIHDKYYDAYELMAMLLSTLGRVDEALKVPIFAAPFTLPIEGGDCISAEALRRKLMDRNFSDTLSRDEISKSHMEWGKDVRAFLGPALEHPLSSSEDPDRRLRIGYISPDLRVHVIAFFMEAPLRHRDTGKFHVTLYYTGCYAEDEASQRLRGLADAWRSVNKMTAEQVTLTIVRDTVDNV